MKLQFSKDFYLEEFKPWGCAVTRYEEIEELGIMEEAQEYIEEVFRGSEAITLINVNDMLWFGMDDFIENFKDDEEDF